MAPSAFGSLFPACEKSPLPSIQSESNTATRYWSSVLLPSLLRSQNLKRRRKKMNFTPYPPRMTRVAFLKIRLGTMHISHHTRSSPFLRECSTHVNRPVHYLRARVSSVTKHGEHGPTFLSHLINSHSNGFFQIDGVENAFALLLLLSGNNVMVDRIPQWIDEDNTPYVPTKIDQSPAFSFFPINNTFLLPPPHSFFLFHIGVNAIFTLL